jgi:hypothetical protein
MIEENPSATKETLFRTTKDQAIITRHRHGDYSWSKDGRVALRGSLPSVLVLLGFLSRSSTARVIDASGNTVRSVAVPMATRDSWAVLGC